ncbi:MAG TPA: hypothetical protein VGU63_01810, partial [Candidatus Acidoferrales bacterium]|nr:hypothetical protein [Candidatus Acidoferrales bacterium]
MSTSGETIPRVGYLLRVLFERTWEHLDASYAKTSEFAFPGVYVLAYSNEQLKGRVIKETDVFYVGVTHAGIRKRLRQFRAGLEYGKHHSGAKRFFIKIAGRTPYSELLDKKIFYVASVSARCN